MSSTRPSLSATKKGRGKWWFWWPVVGFGGGGGEGQREKTHGKTGVGGFAAGDAWKPPPVPPSSASLLSFVRGSAVCRCRLKKDKKRACSEATPTSHRRCRCLRVSPCLSVCVSLPHPPKNTVLPLLRARVSVTAPLVETCK